MGHDKKPNVAVTDGPQEDKHDTIMRKAKGIVDAHMVANDGHMNVSYFPIMHEGVTYRVKVFENQGDLRIVVIQPEQHIAGGFYTRPEGVPCPYKPKKDKVEGKPKKVLDKESLPRGWASLDDDRR